MITLKEMIIAKFDKFNARKTKNIAEQLTDVFDNLHAPSFVEGAKWQHNQLKNEVLPILLECAEALEFYSNENNMVNLTGLPFGRRARQALERLRKWSEGEVMGYTLEDILKDLKDFRNEISR